MGGKEKQGRFNPDLNRGKETQNYICAACSAKHHPGLTGKLWFPYLSPEALVFKAEITLSQVVQLISSQAKSKTQVPALLELGLFHPSTQQIAIEFAKEKEPFLAQNSENWSKRSYPKVTVSMLNKLVLMGIKHLWAL